jgi:N,N'-diacetyllegionaminate synthase
MFLSTAFDFGSIDLLENLNVPVHKIPSGEITNLPYLIKIAQTGKPLILSTGMSTLEEIRTAVEILKQNGSGEITVLHCNTEYPTPYEDVNLKAMLTMQKELGIKVGYSDHTPGIEVPIAAVAMGASVIEKHFTLDKNMEGPDHKASLEPDEFAAMVRAIRNIEKALGTGEKKPSPSEIKNMDIVRKSIVAARDISKGEIFTEDNITVKRPGNGISPMKWFEVLGTTSVKDFIEDELVVTRC